MQNGGPIQAQDQDAGLEGEHAVTLSLITNEEMVGLLEKEELRQICQYFFVCLAPDVFPLQEFLDDWLSCIWSKKMGF